MSDLLSDLTVSGQLIYYSVEQFHAAVPGIIMKLYERRSWLCVFNTSIKP